MIPEDWVKGYWIFIYLMSMLADNISIEKQNLPQLLTILPQRCRLIFGLILYLLFPAKALARRVYMW